MRDGRLRTNIGNVATLLGLLGTVVGLIRAFGAVSAAKPEERSALLAKGISEALNNTAMGLGIAVTCAGVAMVAWRPRAPGVAP